MDDVRVWNDIRESLEVASPRACELDVFCILELPLRRRQGCGQGWVPHECVESESMVEYALDMGCNSGVGCGLCSLGQEVTK